MAVAICDQLSHLLSEDFNTIPNQIICHNRTNTNPSQSCLCIIRLFETQEWYNGSKTIPHVVLSYEIINMRSWQISLFQLVKILLQICLSLPMENTITDSHFKRNRDMEHYVIQTAIRVLSGYSEKPKNAISLILVDSIQHWFDTHCES